MRTPTRFRAETKYAKSTEKKANVNRPVMARVGDGGGVAGVAGRPSFYWIRLVNDDNRQTQCSSLIPLGNNDWIYVARAKDEKLSHYEFVAFIEDAAGGVVPPIQVHDHSTVLLGGTHWGGITQTWGGVSGANIITVPDNLADAIHIVDDGVAAPAAVEYMRIVTTNAGPAQAVIFNNGEVDVDFRVAASGITNALFMQGSDGAITVGGPSMTVPDDWWIGIGGALERIIFDAAGDIVVMGANFGIGDAAAVPSSLLHVNTASTADDVVLAKFWSALDGDGEFNSIRVGRADAAGQCAIFGYRYDTTGGDEGAFITVFGDPISSFYVRKGGNVGIGTPSPLGKLHGFDTHGGFMYWEGNTTDAGETVIIPNGAGDVERVAYFTQLTWNVDEADWGCTDSCIATPANGPSTSDLYVSVGNELQLQLKASGELVLNVTQGNDTYNTVMWIIWQ